MTYPGTKMERISLDSMFCIFLRQIQARPFFQSRKLVGLKVWALNRCQYHLTGFKLWRRPRRHPFWVLFFKGHIFLKIACIRPILRVSASHFRSTCIPLYQKYSRLDDIASSTNANGRPYLEIGQNLIEIASSPIFRQNGRKLRFISRCFVNNYHSTDGERECWTKTTSKNTNKAIEIFN